METSPADKSDEHGVERPTAATHKPSRKRYTRAQLMHYRDTIDLTAPPMGYNPSILKPIEPTNKDLPPPGREGQKWNRTRSMGTWSGQPQGAKGGGLPPFNRMEGAEDPPNGRVGGRALRQAISWTEQQQQPAGGIPVGERSLGRRNSRSDAPGRWDNNKDESLSKSLEKRGSERWMAYGHRDAKDKPTKPTQFPDEPIESSIPDPSYQGHEPEWMHHRVATENTERMKQHRQIAQNFEEERKMMRERTAKERERGDRGENSYLMTDDEINDFKKQLEAEERRSTPMAFTFDSLKEAMKSQGVSNLPPMPTSGINTVDQIERSLKASAQMNRNPMDFNRQNMEVLRSIGQGSGSNPQQAMAQNESTNRLLAMLKGTSQTGSFGNLNPQQMPQMGGFPMGLQQQGLFPGGNSNLERLFPNARMGANVGLYDQQQLHPGMGNMGPPPFMQPANQFNRSAQNADPLLAALIANQQAQTARQAQMMAHLKHAQQQTLAKAREAAAGGQENDDDGESRPKSEAFQTSMRELLSGGQVPNQVQLPFGIPGNLMGARPQLSGAPGMFSPSLSNLQLTTPQNLLQGMSTGVNPGMGGPNPFMQNGLGRPMNPALPGLNLGMRPGMGSMSPMAPDQQPSLNGQPNLLQANFFAQQGTGLNRFFGEQNAGTPGAFADSPAVAPTRNRSLEELKHEAQ